MDKSRLNVARAKIVKGEAFLTQGKYLRAEELFREAIEAETEVPTAYLGLGASLVAQKRFGEALEVLEEAETRFLAWEEMIRLGELEKRQIAERQIQAIRDVAAEAIAKGRSPTALGDPAAVAQRKEARVIQEQFLMRERRQLEYVDAIPPQVFYLEGIAYLRTARPFLGIEALEVCLLLDPNHGLAHYNLAVALFVQGEFAEAKEHLDTAVAAGIEPHARFVVDLERALG
jgi:tetratricopeptide (TPR) repeat protein